MSAGANKKDQWQTRCGRCAFLLPDDTMTFCPMCGIPFSKVQPTQSYLLLEDRENILHKRREYRLKSIFAGVSIVLLVLSFVFYKNYQLHYRYYQISQARSLIFYNYQNDAFPKLSALELNEVVQRGMQAFYDHFQWDIKQYSVLHDALPDSGVEDFLSSTLSIDFYKWQKFVLSKHYKLYRNNPNRPLPVVVTNIPIAIGNEQRRFVAESRHLAESGLIGGLANPGIVVVSTYKALNNQTLSERERFKIDNKDELYRLIAEYFLAHELGHALVGLKDFVVNPQVSDKAPLVRIPAAIPPVQEECLMHTVYGGGGQSWQQLKQRPIAQATQCSLYTPLLKAYRLRKQAFELRLKGQYQQSQTMYQQALNAAEGLLQENLMTIWLDDQQRFF